MQEPTVEEQIAAKFAGQVLEAPVEETETATEPVVETEIIEAVETTEDPTPVQEYLAKYDGDTEKALAAAVEAQKVIGRQSAEVAEAREIQKQLAELKDAIVVQPQTQQPTYDQSSVEDFLATNPQQIPAILEQARANNDGFLYTKALSALNELDPTAAMDYHANAVADAKMAVLREEFAPTLQSVQVQQTGNEFASAFKTQSEKHPDFAQVMNGITQDTLTSIPPELVATLQKGTLESKERVLETLYWASKGQQAGNLSAAAQQVAQEASERAQADRVNAAVASTTATTDREPVEKSPIEQYRENFQNSAAFQKAAGLI